MSDHAVITGPGAIRLQCLLPGPIDRVWAFLTEPDKRKRWFAGGAMAESGPFSLFFQHSNLADEPGLEKYKTAMEGFDSPCRMVRWEPPRALAFDWLNTPHADGGDAGSSLVTWELFGRGDNVLFVITHARLPNRAEMIDVSGGWHAHTDILEAVLAGAKPKPFWANIETLERHYAAAYPQMPRDDAMTTEPVRLEVTRRLPFPAGRVFDAWLDARIARKFLFATDAGEMVRAETAPRVGGTYVFVDRRDGQDVEHTGECLEIDRPRRLVFTLLAPAFSTEPAIVEIDIAPDGPDAYVLTLRQNMAPAYAAWKERSAQGWAMILGNLEKALTHA